MNKILPIVLVSLSLLVAQTDAEVKQAKEVIKKIGMSEAEARASAKSQGYTDKQIDAAIQKELGKTTEQPPSAPTDKAGLPDLGKSNEMDPAQSVLEIADPTDGEELEVVDRQRLALVSETQSGRVAVSYFGYDIFRQDPAVFQASSVGAVDPDYLIGPGDEIIVMLWGETQFRQVFTVDREGFVFIAEIGQVFVNGLNLSMLESKFFKVLSQSYASLNPKGRKPSTFLDVSLGNLRPLRIQVLGEVAQPGAYTVSPSATLFSALYYFNGPTTLGSLRDIRLIRAGQEIASIDFYDYLLTGTQPEDEKLQLDDVIFIPKRMQTVAIEGEINRPGIYELKPSETLSDLISMAGDLKITAYLNRAQIDRIVPFDQREEIGMDRMFTDVNLEQLSTAKKPFPLQDGDRIQIFSVLDLRLNVVELQGAVTRPGRYEIGDSLRLSELIVKADNLLGDTYMERVDIIRINPDFTEQLIKLNLGKAIEGDPDHDIQLQGMDRVRIYGMTEMVPQTYVSIWGHVKRSGSYLLRQNMTVYDLLFSAGGIIDEAFRARTFMDRADLIRFDEDQITKTIIPFNLGNVLAGKDSKQNFDLLPGDEIRVYSKTIFNNVRSIYIDGVIRSPGTYSLKTGMNVKDLILEAGGVSEDVYRYKIEIARIDPEKVNQDTYAEIIKLDMYNDYSIINGENSLKSDSVGVSKDSTECKLRPYDYVSVRPDPFFKIQRNVTITGAVYYPGVYTLIRADEKITDILERAGGLQPKAYPNASTLTRNGQIIRIGLNQIIKKPSSSKKNVILQKGDNIFVAMKPDMTQILGEVASPGIYKFITGKRVNDYIAIAGGFSMDAEKRDIWVTFPNGQSKHYSRWISNPKVLDGSVITVGKEEEAEPFDVTEFAKEITSILANLAQVAVLIIVTSE